MESSVTFNFSLNPEEEANSSVASADMNDEDKQTLIDASLLLLNNITNTSGALDLMGKNINNHESMECPSLHIKFSKYVQNKIYIIFKENINIVLVTSAVCQPNV